MLQKKKLSSIPTDGASDASWLWVPFKIKMEKQTEVSLVKTAKKGNLN